MTGVNKNREVTNKWYWNLYTSLDLRYGLPKEIHMCLLYYVHFITPDSVCVSSTNEYLVDV